MSARLTRREALRGSLVLAFTLLGPRALGQSNLPGDLAVNENLDAWLQISASGGVTLKVGKVELGQGILTALGQLCADELDIDLARLSIISGDTALCPNEGTTTGSVSMSDGGTAVRYAAAEARAILLEMGAKQLGASAARLRVQDGSIADPASGRSVTYWSLIGGKTFNRKATGSVAPKPAPARRYIGRPVPRRDLPAKITGEAIFVQDFRAPNMVHGRVVRAPSHGASLLEVDEAAAAQMPGVLKVVRDGDFLGVIAEKEWQAIKAAAKLVEAARWREVAALPIYPYAWLTSQPSEDAVIHRVERAAGTAPSLSLEASYQRPYQKHGAIGPSCAVAELTKEGLTIYTHSQSVFMTAEAIAKMLGMPVEKVRARHMNGSGCYGHNGADDAAADAALLARALPDRPVRVQWSRADEHGYEPYGSAMVMKVRAGLSTSGDVLDWSFDLWSTSHNTRPSGQAGNLLAARTLAKPFATPTPRSGRGPSFMGERNAIPLYAFPGQVVTAHFVAAMPLRVSAHRSLGAYGNVFAIESFMDEIAAATQVDPVEFRMRHLEDARARDVVRLAAERFGWREFKRSPGRGRGFAFARYKNFAGYAAVALEVAVQRDTGRIQVLRAVAAADSGEAVNPDGIRNQIEGGIIQSLSWTLFESVTMEPARITSVDWGGYPIMRFSSVPTSVEVHLISRLGQPFLGTGESAQGSAGAALANAVADATGARLRDIPFTPQRVRAAVGA